MKNTYILTMPTPDMAKAIGIKLEGFPIRISQWLCGIAFGLVAVDSAVFFTVLESRNTEIVVKTDSWPLMGTIMEHIEEYGITMTQMQESPLLSKEQCVARVVPA